MSMPSRLLRAVLSMPLMLFTVGIAVIIAADVETVILRKLVTVAGALTVATLPGFVWVSVRASRIRRRLLRATLHAGRPA